jgi:glyoxylase-like metal-dependent hydrolase (beta-lactamase superfamily II)
MEVDYRIISIGALSRNRMWDETAPKRTSHATTTLIRDEHTTILVDPSLPVEILAQRLDERAGIAMKEVDVVFLTSFRPVHRRALPQFERATWLLHEPEFVAMQSHLSEMHERLSDEDKDVERLVSEETAMLERCRPAPEKLTSRVHLFPASGVTPGSAGLLLASASQTVVVAGDAVLTKDYFLAGRVFEQATDVSAAQESFSEIMGIADEIVPGHDNVFRVFGR